MNKNIFILVVITFLLTGFFNNSKGVNISIDSIINQNNSNLIEHDIVRNCKDSIVQDILNKKIYLYGESSIKYGNIKITAHNIIIDWNENTILAIGTKDSIGNSIGDPVFSEGSESFKAKEILYNLKSKKCIVKKIMTQEGEGYIHGEKVKKLENEWTNGI